jgi:hypothetical protein
MSSMLGILALVQLKTRDLGGRLNTRLDVHYERRQGLRDVSVSGGYTKEEQKNERNEPLPFLNLKQLAAPFTLV